MCLPPRDFHDLRERDALCASIIAMTSAFLLLRSPLSLPFLAGAGFLAGLAFFVAFAFFAGLAPLAGFLGFGASGWLSTARSAIGWIAAQIRATAFLRSVNFVTSLFARDAVPDVYKPAERPVGGYLGERCLESKVVAVESPACAAAAAVANTVMLLSFVDCERWPLLVSPLPPCTWRVVTFITRVGTQASQFWRWREEVAA